MATVTMALENPRYRYGSYESVEVVEASGSLCKVRTPNGDEFWVRTAKLKPVRQAKAAKKIKNFVSRAWNPEFELFFTKVIEADCYLEFCGSEQYHGLFDDEYYAITGVLLDDKTKGRTRRYEGGGTTYNITIRKSMLPFVPGSVHHTNHSDGYSSISSKEIFFELIRRGLRLGSNHGNKS